MSHGNWRGSFAIPMTPFDERDRIDENVLAAEIEFCVASGVVWIQNAGLVPLSLDQVVRLCTEIEHVCWVKEEVSPGPQRISELLDAGKEAAARDLFEHVLPGLTLEGLMGMAFTKEIMMRRGIFRNHRMHSQARPLDAHDLREIDRVWERIQPYLIWRN
jgi:dihydrodipicolinate synthase/N-acetylneuraminate lyase